MKFPNLYYQDNGADICRQLAGHTSLRTSFGYYTNVSNTVLATSIMQLQRRLNFGYQNLEQETTFHEKKETALSTYQGCTSTYLPKLTGDIRDCISENQLETCFGCKYYSPGETELNEEMQNRKKALDDATLAVLDCVNKGLDDEKIDFEKVFLDAHSGIVRYRTACDIEAEERMKKWQRHRNSATSCS